MSSRYSNHFNLDPKDYERYMDMVDSKIGRYPIGFRHYESYENYCVVNPDASIEDYSKESIFLSVKIIIYYSE